MSKKDILETVLFFLKAIIVYSACYFIAFNIKFSLKNRGKRNTYLKILIANVICLSFFLIYGLLDNYWDIKVVFLATLWFLLFPLSSLLIIIFGILFFFEKRQK